MSLINDALRKARREAAVRGERPDAPEVVVILSPKRTLAERPGLLLALGVALVAAVLLGGAAVWWAVRAPAAGNGGAEVPVAAGGDAAPSPVPAAVSPAPPAAEQRRREAHRAGSRPAGAVRGPRSRPPGGTGPPVPKPPVPFSSPPTPSPRPAVAAGPAPSGAREFVGEAHVGGVTLVLDYLVYRPSDPFVQINGVELHQGWEISGYTVERIQTDRVILRGPAGKVVIRSH